jgi:ATP-dependent DNA ligase
MKAMLAQSIDSAKLLTYAQDDKWWFQQKVDGIRAVLLCENGQVRPLNRNGESLTKDVPYQILTALKPIASKTCVVDGEMIEGVFYVFDLPTFGSAIGLRSPYHERLEAAELVVATLDVPIIRTLRTATTTAHKLALARDVLAAGLEGVIVRDKNAPYVPGLRAPTLLKAKFTKDADCVIMAVNLDGKQNMRLGVYDTSGTLVSVGECTGLAGDGPTICNGLPNNPGAYVGSVVKVRYLSMYHKRLYQPNLPYLRTDKAAQDCTIDQFKTTDRRVLA